MKCNNGKKYLFSGLLYLFACLLPGCGHRATLRFERQEIQIGKITDNSNVYFSLSLINEGKEDIVIEEIKSSLSNVAVQEKIPGIPAGDTAGVAMVVIGNGLEGDFIAKVDVVVAGEIQPWPVFVKGYVEKTLPSIEKRCVIPFGGLKTDRREVSFGKIEVGKIYRDTLLVYNPGKDIVSVRPLQLQGGAKGQLADPYVRPGKAAYLVVELKVDDLKSLGKFFQNLLFEVEAAERSTGMLMVEADVVENFDSLSREEWATAPVLEVENPKFDFGTILAGTNVSHQYVLKNKGERSLIIRKVQAFCGCTVAEPENRVIPPGQSTTLNTVFRSAGRSGTQQKSIQLFTNDPKQSEIKLWITGKVVMED